jgi:hypothetical protein
LLLAGVQPATVEVTLGTDKWRFVIEEVDQPLSFGSQNVSIRGRSLAAAASFPYQAQESWLADSITTAAQVCTLANTFTGVEVDWRVQDWIVPEGGWSATADPLGVVRQFAAAVRADVEAHQTEMKITVRPRYPLAPNLWASSAPDVQIPWQAVEFARQERADQPGYDAVLVAGQQTGGTLIARLAGTSGSLQAPMVTDALLTDTPALTELATTLLYGYGGKVRETRTLQMHGGVIARGSLVRCVEPTATWSGLVRSVSVAATFDKARQTLGIERPTSFAEGTSVSELCVLDPSWGSVKLMLHCDEGAGALAPADSSTSAVVFTKRGNAAISEAQAKFGRSSIFIPDSTSSFDAPGYTGLDFANGEFIIEAWVRPTAFNTINVVATNRNALGSDLGWSFGYYTGTAFFLAWGTTPGAVVASMSGGVVSLNVWQKISISRVVNTLFLAVNNVVVATAPLAAAIGFTSGNKLVIGADPSAAGRNALGHTDELRITKGEGRISATTDIEIYPFCNHA